MSNPLRCTEKLLSTVFQDSDDGITAQGPKVYPCVCPEDAGASFTLEIADELIVTKV